MKRKFLSLILTAVLIFLAFSLLTACNDEEAPSGAPGGTVNETINNSFGASVEGGSFPTGSSLVTSPVDQKSDSGKAALEAIAGQEYNVFKPVYIFDISVVKDNAKVQPNGKVRVSIPVTADLASYKTVLHIKDGGTVERLSATYADGKLSFETDSFSIFVLVEPVVSNMHTHAFSQEWSQSATHHWHACLGEKCEAKEDLAEHYYDDNAWWDIEKPATETETGIAVRICIGCKYEDRRVIPALDPNHKHTFDNAWTSNSLYHWHAATCGHVNEVEGMAEHTWDDGVITKVATLEEDGTVTYTCIACGATKTESYSHEHTFSDAWSSDDDYHWHAPSCGHTAEPADKAEHSWNDGEITTPATPDKDGTKTYTCTVCGRTKEESYVYVAHTHTFSDEWSCDDDYHWHDATCEHTAEIADKAEHTWGTPFVERDPSHIDGGLSRYTCTACGKTKVVTTPHMHVYKDWFFSPTYHWQITNCGYSVCRNIRGPQSPHEFEDGYCKDCGMKDPSVASEGLEFTLQEDGTYFVSGLGTCTDMHLVIPSEHEGKAVTGVAGKAFQNKRDLNSVYLPDSIKTVGDMAFLNCSKLNSVRLPDEMIYIGESAFSYSNLHTLALPTKGINKIEAYAFQHNQYIIDLYIPDNIKIVGEKAFYECTGVKELRLPETMTALGVQCFAGLNMTSVTIPKGITELPNGVFAACGGLTSVTVPDWIKIIGDEAFSQCSNLKEVSLPEGLTSIGVMAFAYDSALTSITVPSTISEIKEQVFYGCSELAEVNLPSSLTVIGPWAFFNCIKLTAISLPSDLTDIGYYAFSNSGLESITIPNKLKAIGNYAFYQCRKLTSVQLPDGLLKIGDHSFAECTAIEEISIPDGVTEILSGAFSWCTALSSFNIPTSLTKISSYAFAGTKIKSITIPDGVAVIDDGAFSSCSELTAVIFGSGSKVTFIGYGAFQNCNKLTAIALPSLLEVIEQYAFANCEELTTVTVPPSIKNIEESAFENSKIIKYNEYDNAYYLGNEDNPYLVLIQVKDKNAVSCTIHSSTAVIAARAFYNSSITEITIPDSVKIICSGAFYRSQLEAVTLASTDDWCFIMDETAKTYCKYSESYSASYWIGSSATDKTRASQIKNAGYIFREGFLPSYTNAGKGN